VASIHFGPTIRRTNINMCWYRVSSLKNVVMQAYGANLCRSRAFNLLTNKYDVISGQCTVVDIRRKKNLIHVLILITLPLETSVIVCYDFKSVLYVSF